MAFSTMFYHSGDCLLVLYWTNRSSTTKLVQFMNTQLSFGSKMLVLVHLNVIFYSHYFVNYFLQHFISHEITVHGTLIENFSRTGSGSVNLSRLLVGLDLTELASSQWSSTSLKFEVNAKLVASCMNLLSIYVCVCVCAILIFLWEVNVLNENAACTPSKWWWSFYNLRSWWIPTDLQVVNSYISSFTNSIIISMKTFKKYS